MSDSVYEDSGCGNDVHDAADNAAGRKRLRRLETLDEELGDRDTFVPGAPICDLRVAVWASYALPSPAQIAWVRLFDKFRDQFAIAPGSVPRLERVIKPWIDLLG